MNRAEFFIILQRELSKVSKEEKEEALQYYNEYFDEAGLENEQKVIDEIGSPIQIAARIKADTAVKKLENHTSVKTGISAVWLIILAIFAAPVALPLAIVGAVLVFSFFLILMIIGIVLILCVAAFFLAGIVLIASGITALHGSISTAIFMIGIGITVLGITLLIGMLVVIAGRSIFGGAARGMNRQLNKKAKGDDVNE